MWFESLIMPCPSSGSPMSSMTHGHCDRGGAFTRSGHWCSTGIWSRSASAPAGRFEDPHEADPGIDVARAAGFLPTHRRHRCEAVVGEGELGKRDAAGTEGADRLEVGSIGARRVPLVDERERLCRNGIHPDFRARRAAFLDRRRQRPEADDGGGRHPIVVGLGPHEDRLLGFVAAEGDGAHRAKCPCSGRGTRIALPREYPVVTRAGNGQRDLDRAARSLVQAHDDLHAMAFAPVVGVACERDLHRRLHRRLRGDHRRAGGEQQRQDRDEDTRHVPAPKMVSSAAHETGTVHPYSSWYLDRAFAVRGPGRFKPVAFVLRSLVVLMRSVSYGRLRGIRTADSCTRYAR